MLNGTPGTLKQRIQSGKRYWVREYIRVDGAKVDEYLGAEASLAAERIAELRAEIELARSLASGSAQLRLFGYQRIERKPAAVLAVFFNRGLSQAGLTLVGAHAYAALLNELGVLAPGYRTQDIGVARSRSLVIALPQGLTFQELLRESGLPFVPVPGMPSHRPSASFKLPGVEALAVDLLVPGDRAIPLLDFLIREPLDSVILSPNQVIPVKLPSPERFVLHKLLSSQSRSTHWDKAGKDLDQAATLAAVLEEEMPGRLSQAFRGMPAAGKAATKRGARAAARRLANIHPQGEEALLELVR